MSSHKRPSATSLPPSPRDDESSRLRKYMLTMGIRIACLLLMVFVHPYGWYTWVFGAGAIVLPYIAVVIANVGKDAHEPHAESPELALPPAPSPPPADDASPRVIRIPESRPLPSGDDAAQHSRRDES
ncbi:MAG: DUF3099 domain-containing protein [Microbacterium sp.]